MASRKSMAHVLLESAVHTPSVSSPLRRKSILPQRPPPSDLSENDDEAERLARRREISSTSTPLSSIHVGEKRRSLGLGFLAQMPSSQISERITECIKLSAENKINLKNAFSLEMIDFMTYMIKKQDANMSNLQVASTSLDVSTKIYGFRVDGVHMEILKMIGGLDKQEKNEECSTATVNTEQKMDTQQDNDESHESRQDRKKKKKKNKQRIFSTVDALKTVVEIAKPSPMTLNDADLQTADMLCQAILPNHANSGFYQHQYNDVLVDTIEEKTVQDKELTCTIPKIEDFSELEICPPLCSFDFQGWSAEDEPEESKSEKNNDSGFHFDFDATIPPDDAPMPSSMSYFDVENEQENVERCIRGPNEVENIVDFREVLTNPANPAKVSEYSFIQKSLNIHWAGPSHWKVNNFKKILSNSRVVEVCQQAPNRKRKEIEMSYENDIKEAVKAKFLPSQAIKLQARTAKTDWSEEKLTLPPDEHYDIIQANKLYLHSQMIGNHEKKEDLDATHISDGIDNYDYNNENDTSNYCPDVNNGDYRATEENADGLEEGVRCEDEGALGTQIPLTGDNLVAVPKLANKTCIAYCLKAKKIDMRQLKKSIWKCLVSKNNKENMNIQEAVEQGMMNKMKESKHFSEIYKTLPNMLSKTNAEALSFPISFVSLLHLANEKTLKINTLPDMSDLIVEGD